MASAHSDGPGSICLVTNDLDHIVRNSGIGTYYSLVAPLLANAGWRVHILYLGYADNLEGLAQAPINLRREGIGFSLLRDFDTPKVLQARSLIGCHGEVEPGKGVRILHALEELHRVHHFDLIEFPDWLAWGFRTIQARRTGRCLGSARLCVKLHGTSAWQRESNHSWPDGPGELSLDFRERYAFENADVQMAPSRYMVDYVEQQGWRIGDAVVAYPFPEPVVPTRRNNAEQPNEVVFFGRLELRKGLDLFLDAVKHLPGETDVTFLGRDTVLPSGLLATAYIEQRMGGRPFKLITNLMRVPALKYLAAENRLAVIASRSETFGFTVAECAVNGVPFVAARAGGTCEVIPEPEIQESLFFDPTARDLRRSLIGYLQMSQDRRHALRVQAQKSVDPTVRNRQLIEAYQNVLERYRQEFTPRFTLSIGAGSSRSVESNRNEVDPDTGWVDSEADSSESPAMWPIPDAGSGQPSTVTLPGPLVTVAVAHYNLGLYLPATLEAIAAQVYPHIEVIVVDDGSTCPISIRVFNELKELFPRFRFISQRNGGPGAARNHALKLARGEFFVPVDADNVPTPTMIERFVEGMDRNPDVSVLTCFLKAFQHDEGLESGGSEYIYMPTGGPFVLSCFENVFGDTNAIFRTQDFRAAGGFETDPDTFIEDWETFVRLAARGLKIDVIPEALFHYRLRGDNRSLTMSREYTDTYPYVQRMIHRRFVSLTELNTLDREMLWLGMAAFGNRWYHRPVSPVPNPPLALRYRVADKVNSCLKWITPLHRVCRSIVSSVIRASGGQRLPSPVTLKTGATGDNTTAAGRRRGIWGIIRKDIARKAA
jgi:glycosyltransferase involved in cell wall biosynthesis